VAQEEDEKAEESSEVAQEVDSPGAKAMWGYGVVWYPYGLQLWE